MNKETVVVSLLKPSNGRSLFTNPQHLIYHSLTYRRGKEKDYDLIVIKTLEMVSKNYYYIIRGVFFVSIIVYVDNSPINHHIAIVELYIQEQ